MKGSNNNNNSNHRDNKHANGLIPNSLKFISSCIKTASSGVRSAGASVAASISGDTHEHKDQVLWSSFDRLELNSSSFKNVLLLGYSNGFQVLDVEDASNVNELVSRRDDSVTFLQMQPLPAKSDGHEGFINSHPLLLVVACDESKSSGALLNRRDEPMRDGYDEPQIENVALSPTAVRFYSLRSHNYVHVLRFRSTVYMVRCSPRIVAVGLAVQIYCFDARTLENKFSVLTYPVTQFRDQGMSGINIGYGPMALGSRWLAYASNNPLLPNTGRLSSQSLTPPVVSPSTSPSNGSLLARYAAESSKQLAAGLISLGDMGYKTLSRYYQDFIPDGSRSPVSSNSSWKVGRNASHSDTDIAGMVVIKDFISRAVISQFRAHTSPISALCFDPSGTLLVTGSIHGNNINIFRIIPSCSKHWSGSATQTYDWSSSHVHLYKLHRGMTQAVIQDIRFSPYSQWIAIVSSRGTCHIFVLAPFGGETVLQIKNSHVDGPTLSPVLSLPWWSSPSFMINQQSFSLPLPPPPPTVSLSVVSRIKNNNSGWLNTVSSATSSTAGIACIPSGSIAAVFHSSGPQDLQPFHLKSKSLEHLLVHTPSGHVVQYKLLSSIGGETNETCLKMGPGSAVLTQDEELGVKVEAVQSWDVCRRTEWPERGECISGITLGKREASEMIMDTLDCEDNDIGNKEFLKLHNQSQLYLSNAEVLISSGRIPIWQNSKIHFYTMSPLMIDEHISAQEHSGGEIELEQIPIHYVEIKWKDLLPFFDHFHRIQSDWSERGIVGGRSSLSSSNSYEAKETFSEEAVITQSKSASHGSVENSDDGASKISYPSKFQYANENTGTERGNSVSSSPILNQSTLNKDSGSISFKQSAVGFSPTEDTNFSNAVSFLSNGSLSAGKTKEKEVKSSTYGGTHDVSNIITNHSDLSTSILDEDPLNGSLDFEHFFQEESCKALVLSGRHESIGVVTDVDGCNITCDKEKSGEDGDNDKSEDENDNDDMLGGVFTFSEEGRNLKVVFSYSFYTDDAVLG